LPSLIPISARSFGPRHSQGMNALAPLSRPELIAKYDGRAPRYTSYPTAAQFTPAVDAATYRRWLAALPRSTSVSLYAHIPFCKRLCWYCGCNTRAVNRPEPIRDYAALLMQEIAMVREALPGRLRAHAAHLGGGTPNMLQPAEMDALFKAWREAFDLAPDAEISAEIDPAVLTRHWVSAAALNGLNRASLGVQNLDPEVQKAVNRRETFSEIEKAFGWLREADVKSINVDLMYGLPSQTVDNTLSTIEAILSLRPERLALFGYAHVPWMKAHQRLIDEGALPWPAERLAQSEAAGERLTEAGYVQIGIDHFALPEDSLAKAAVAGELHRNFQGYTTEAGAALIGFGASSISSLPQGFVQNLSQEADWRKAVAAGDLPVSRGVALTDDDRFRGEIIERLMCDFEADLAAVCGRHGRALKDIAQELSRLPGLVHDGLAEWREPVLKVTAAGRPVVRSICAIFDSHLQPGAGRHAKAI